MKQEKQDKFTLYNGEITLEFNEGAHRYKVNGEYKEGVTTILNSVTSKDGLIDWAAGLASNTLRDTLKALLKKKGTLYPEDIDTASEDAKKAHTYKKNKGGDVGTQTHKIIADYIQSQIDKVNTPIQENENTQVSNALRAFREWNEKYQPDYLLTEQPVYSIQNQYCGTLDCLARIDGKITMIDFKTGNPKTNYYTKEAKSYPKDFLQCAAYDIAYSEETNISAEQYMLVYITKTGELHTFINDELAENKEAWLAALVLSRRFKKLERM